MTNRENAGAWGGVGGGGLVEQVHADHVVTDAVTTTASSRPRVSVMIPRLRPRIFLPASVPWVTAGTLVEVFTICVSRMDAVGSICRP